MIIVIPPLSVRTASPLTVVMGDFAVSVASALISIIGALIVMLLGSSLILLEGMMS